MSKPALVPVLGVDILPMPSGDVADRVDGRGGGDLRGDDPKPQTQVSGPQTTEPPSVCRLDMGAVVGSEPPKKVTESFIADPPKKVTESFITDSPKNTKNTPEARRTAHAGRPPSLVRGFASEFEHKVTAVGISEATPMFEPKATTMGGKVPTTEVEVTLKAAEAAGTTSRKITTTAAEPTTTTKATTTTTKPTTNQEQEHKKEMKNRRLSCLGPNTGSDLPTSETPEVTSPWDKIPGHIREEAVEAVRDAAISPARVVALNLVLSPAAIDLLVHGPTPDKSWSKAIPAFGCHEDGKLKAAKAKQIKLANTAEITFVRDLLDRGYAPREVAAILLDTRFGIGVRARQGDDPHLDGDGGRPANRVALVLAMGLNRESHVVNVDVAKVNITRFAECAVVCMGTANEEEYLEQKLYYADVRFLHFALFSAGIFEWPEGCTAKAAASLLADKTVSVVLRKDARRGQDVAVWVPQLPAPSPTAEATSPPEWAPRLEAECKAMAARPLIFEGEEWVRKWPKVEGELLEKIEIAKSNKDFKNQEHLEHALETARRMDGKIGTTGFTEIGHTLVMRSSGRLMANRMALNSLHRPLRTSIVAKPGHKLIYADHSTMHPRVRAALAQQCATAELPGVFQGLFAAGVDVYVHVGKHIWPELSVDPKRTDEEAKKARKDQRNLGKGLLLAWSNCSGAKQVADNLNLLKLVDATEAKAKVWLAKLDRMFPLFTAWNDRPNWWWPDSYPSPGLQDPRDHKSFTSPLGRRIPFRPDRWERDRRTGQWAIEKPAMVYAIGESIEADCMIMVLALWEQTMAATGAVPVLLMFDGMLVEVPDDGHAEAAGAKLKLLMERSLAALCPGVVPKVTVTPPMDRWQQK